MSEVGVRELRQNLSRYLDRVKAGEALVVTEHGREVARLVPLASNAYAEVAARFGADYPPATVPALYLDTSVLGRVLLGEPDAAAILRELGEFEEHVSSRLLRV